jgi:hypothetical protein
MPGRELSKNICRASGEWPEEAGRDPGSLPVTLGGAPENLDELKRYRDLGVARTNVRLPAAKASEILPMLDLWAKLIPQVRQ